MKKVNTIALVLALLFLGLGGTELYTGWSLQNNYALVPVKIKNITERKRRKDVRYVYEVIFYTQKNDSIYTQVQENTRYAPPKQQIRYYKKNPVLATFQEPSGNFITGGGLTFFAFLILGVGIWIERKRRA